MNLHGITGYIRDLIQKMMLWKKTLELKFVDIKIQSINDPNHITVLLEGCHATLGGNCLNFFKESNPYKYLSLPLHW